MDTPPLDAAADSATAVESFLTALARGDVDSALGMITDDIEWVNVSLPTLRGARLVGRSLRAMNSPWLGFDAILHHVASTDGVVLTERTDLLSLGPLSIEFWVCGTFELRDGKVAVWRDYFSFRDLLRGTVIGLVRLALGRRGGRSTGYLGAR
ncbi:epoxide hydrolase [Rhodococcus spelaei]|uniref:Epoxide hydrolase n=1 Tax=Rhodococcus spelaei TaxID=2546320 RepID=A0A541BNJ6_9NOCA|nr:limonene-1,2-epoxide hydrolase family protein [Rhodococcus spelaei]TQF73901.1 epoxide hydrolase [Rhodococcus spelaei]